jgi:hypothetical protein
MKFKYQKLPFDGHDPRKPLIARPLLPVFLVNGARKTRSPYYALLDSGADKVLFPADLAEEVGIKDIETGTREGTMGIAGQRVDMFYHPLAVQVLGDEKMRQMLVGFSKQIALPLLGRTFFAHFRAVTFWETKEEMELKD